MFQSPHRRGGSRDQIESTSCPNNSTTFQSPHRRGGSRDLLSAQHARVMTRRFNPLIGGADRATIENPDNPASNFPGFNPLIGGADRATCVILPRNFARPSRFQSPHRRGGSRDIPERVPRSRLRGFGFQSPHRRGGSRDEVRPEQRRRSYLRPVSIPS